MAEQDGIIYGAAGYNFKHPGLFYCHSLFAVGKPEAAVRLVQAIRKQAKRCGFQTVDFVVSQDQPSLLKLLASGTARMKQVWMEIQT